MFFKNSQEKVYSKVNRKLHALGGVEPCPEQNPPQKVSDKSGECSKYKPVGFVL